MSARGIKAGRAFIEIAAEDNTKQGIARAQASLQSLASGLYLFKNFAQWGMDAVRGVVNVAQGFADQGSQIHDMALATGVGAEQLSALGYAAKQSGVDMAAVGAGMRGLAKLTGGVASGSRAAQDTLRKLGISAGDFLAATPADRLGMIADGLDGIADPGSRADLAMEALGKSGADLIPMLHGGSAELNKMIAQAGKLGLVITADDAAKADALGDAWDDLRMVLSSIAFKVGRAAAESLTAIFQAVTPLIVGVGRFIDKNRVLVLLFALGAAAAVAISASLIGLGAIVAGIAVAIGGLATVGTALAAMFAALFSPIGLVVAGVVAVGAAIGYGIYYFLRFTQTGQVMLSMLTGMFNKLWSIASTTLQGIFDALAAGNLSLAAAVAGAGIYAAFAQTWGWIKQGFFATANYAIQSFLTMAKSVQAILQGIWNSTATVLSVVAHASGNPLIGAAFGGMAGREPTIDFSAIKTTVQSVTDSQIKAAQKQVDAAKLALEAAAGAAAGERKRVEREAAAKAKKLSAAGGAVAGERSIGGTFSAAAAGLLGRAGQSLAERTAMATEAMAADMKAVRETLEDGEVMVGA
jgi:hypothetical protein